MHTVKANIRSRNRRQDHQGLQQNPNNLPQVVIKFIMIKGHNKIPTTISRQLYSARKITNMSLESFSSKLQSCDWQSTLSKKDPTEPYAAFIKEFFELYNKSFPMKKYRSKNTKRTHNPWISRGLKKSSKTKEILYKNLIKNPSEKNERKYKLYRNKLNHLIRIAKKSYYSKKTRSK